MSMTIQSSVKDKILATSSETSKVKANVVIEALSRKERVKPRRVRAMAMTIQYGVRGMILTAQSEAFKQENVPLVGSEWSRPMTIKIEMDDLPRGFGRRYRKVLRTSACSLDEIEVDKILCFVEEPVKNSDYEVMRFLTSLLDDGRGSGSWMFLFVWSGYAAMRTLLWAGKVVCVLKLVDSLDLDGENRERTRLRLFQFSLRDQASNWLERLPAGSITTWEDLTTRFLAQFFPPGRTAKLRNDILMFQQHHGESLSEAWTRFKDLLQKVPHHGIDLWLQDLALYDNESWNDPRDFAKPVKAIALPQDVLSTSDRRLIELENQVQRLMEAHLALTQPTQGDDEEVMFIELIRKNDDSSEGEPEEEGSTTAEGIGAEHFDTFPTRSELAYHKYLMCSLILSIFLRNPIITEGCPSKLKIPCNIGHVHVEKAYIDPNSPLKPMTHDV
ncbi:MAK10-like protein [Tanacetum coccineum]